MIRRIAFFDFDGTITTQDTMLEFIRFKSGTFMFYLGFLIYSPFLIAYKLRMFSNQRAKEMILRFFFGNMTITEFDKYCVSFTEHILPSLIRPKAMMEIKSLKEKGAEVVVVSASPENWVARWCDNNGIRCLATRLHTSNGKISGRIDGNNCHGHEKVIRVKQAYDLKDFDEIICYGDTNGDKPLLELATIAFYQPFR